MVPTDDPDYCFSASKSYLDFILVVGASCGIDMFVPNTSVDHNFSIKFNLHLQIKPFKAKYGTLGFDPTGAMWSIGETPSEELWIGMPTQDFFDDPMGIQFEMDQKHGDTRLSAGHCRIMRIFIIWVLAQIPGRDIYILNMWEADIWSSWCGLEEMTNAL